MNNFVKTFILVSMITSYFSSTQTTETCENTIVNIYGEGSYLLGPIYANAQTGYSVRRSSLLDVHFIYNRTNGISGLTKLAKRDNGNLNDGIREQTLTFAATELPLSAEQQLMFPELLMIPVKIIPLAIVFKLPKISSMNFSTQSIADIYLGKIKKWNDPALQKLNPTIFLPNETIHPVARMDKDSSETFVFTSALSSISAQWNESFGTFMDPLFPADECCDSQKWPRDTISYFGNTANGMTGIVSSIPYTIGYTTVYDAILTKATYGMIYNKMGTLTSPSVQNTQASGLYFKPASNTTSVSTATATSTIFAIKSFYINTVNVPAVDAYPFTTLTYIVVNRSTSPDVTCCAMQELIGFILYLYSNETAQLNEQYHIVPFLDSFNAFLIQFMFPLITCQGKSMYAQYMATLIKKEPSDSSKTIITTISVVFCLVLLLLVLCYGFYWRRIKNIKENAWVINSDEFKLIEEENDVFDENMSVKNYSIHSFHNDENFRRETNENMKKFKALWNRNGNKLILTKLYFCSRKWPDNAKQLLTKFTKEFQHDNVALFYGMTEISNTFCIVRQLFPKGTLHRCLMYSEYEISSEMKCCISKNVIDGLKYLHRKHVAHGFLNSLSCYVDTNWTVKIGDWQCLTLFKFQKDGLIGDMIDQKRTAIDSDNDLIELLYLDPNLKTYDQKEIYHSDMYSYGNLLVEIFSRNLPYWKQVQSGMCTYQSIITAKFGQGSNTSIPVSPIDDSIPENIRIIITLCLADISKRPDVNWVQSEVNHLFNVHSSKGIVDIVMSSMEKCIDDRTFELKSMTTRLEGILNEVMPPQIASKLLAGEMVLPEFYDSCTIFFSDIVGFTTISAKSTPMDVMAFLNEIWIIFDKILEQFDVYKVDTIGDAYMVASGVPNRNGILHCRNIADFALSLSEETKNYSIKHIPDENLKIRMGINSGPVTAGIVGRKMPQYCLFGDTVNTSSRMESTSLPGKIQVSSNTHDLLHQYFPNYHMVIRGNVEVKGKGKMTTYWLIDEKDISISENLFQELADFE